MINYEKLCKFLDIIKQPRNYYYTSANWHYPIFDEKKQIELIRILIEKAGFTGYFTNLDTDTNDYVMCFHLRQEHNPNFTEALAGLVLQLLKAGELNKEKVRKVLE